jgi:pyruvate dehydrogenase E2 component (dihydrolipoamide acetyltransferase)
MSEFRMPSLGADMEAGTLIEWLKQPGDPVRRGDIVAVVETQKGAIEIEIFESGVLKSLAVRPGEKVAVGTVLAVVDGGEERAAVGSKEATAVAARVPPVSAAVVPTGRAPAAPSPSGGRLRISPAARRRAEAAGVPIAALHGSGAEGAITLEDVERAISDSAAAVPARSAPTLRLDGMRQAIAAAMARSKREVPHYYLDTLVDMSAALNWLEETNKTRPVTERLLYGALLLKAVAVALRKVPELNGYWSEGSLRPSAAVHVGWAISLRGGGLVAPAIHDVDHKPVGQVMAELRGLVERARSGGLRSSELADSTITVTSLGEQAPDGVFGIIYPPQVALVGFGGVKARPLVVGGAIVARRTIRASLSADHRASDGHRGAIFLTAVEKVLQNPEAL